MHRAGGYLEVGARICGLRTGYAVLQQSDQLQRQLRGQAGVSRR